jgi:hypothetical protein
VTLFLLSIRLYEIVDRVFCDKALAISIVGGSLICERVAPEKEMTRDIWILQSPEITKLQVRIKGKTC